MLVELVQHDLGVRARFSSITIRMPSRSDSSRRSLMPSIFFSRTSSAMLLDQLGLVDLVGDLGDDDLCAPLLRISSISARART